jgi:multiple sugar transport system substrate-binding protein
VADSPQLKKEAELASQYGVGFAGIKESAALSVIMQDALGRLVTEELTPQEVVNTIQQQYVDALK